MERGCVCKEMANAFALLPLQLPLSYEEALRSLPEPPPNRSSVHPA